MTTHANCGHKKIDKQYKKNPIGDSTMSTEHNNNKSLQKLNFLDRQKMFFG